MFGHNKVQLSKSICGDIDGGVTSTGTMGQCGRGDGNGSRGPACWGGTLRTERGTSRDTRGH